MTDGDGQNTWDTVLAPWAVAHDELTGEAMQCVHSFTGHLSHGATRVMSQALPCLMTWALMNQPCPTMNHPVPLLTQTCQRRSPLGFSAQKMTNGDNLGGMEFACFPG